MIEITEDKQYELAEHAEKVLKHAGKLMQCLEDMCEDGDESMMGHRGGYGQRGGYMGERYVNHNGNISGRADSYPMDSYRMGEREGSIGQRGGRMGRRMNDPYYE